MSEANVVLWGFWGAFIIDIGIVIFAMRMLGRIGESPFADAVKYAGASAFVFGLHHIMELFLEGRMVGPIDGIAIAESVEGVAAILLGLAGYSLYKIVQE